MSELKVENLHVNVDNKEILKGVDFTLKKNSITVLMGPNGAGKSTISNALLGNPKYEIKEGSIILNGEELKELDPNERAQKGLFMTFQHPVEIDGVTMVNFLRTSYNSIKQTSLKVHEFHKLLIEKMKELDIDSKFRTRFVNKGFSGGEKKRSEILQLLLFEPEFAILDEIDSGLDVDALKIVAKGIKKVRDSSETGLLIITHHNKILEYLEPDNVLILKNGKIVEEGGKELAKRIEEKGFAN